MFIGKQAIVSSSLAAESVAIQLAQLVGVAESHGLEKSVYIMFRRTKWCGSILYYVTRNDVRKEYL